MEHNTPEVDYVKIHDNLYRIRGTIGCVVRYGVSIGYSETKETEPTLDDLNRVADILVDRWSKNEPS